MRSINDLRQHIEASGNFLNTNDRAVTQKYLKENELEFIIRHSSRRGSYVLDHPQKYALHAPTLLTIKNSSGTYKISMEDRVRGDRWFDNVDQLFSYITTPTQTTDEGLEDSGAEASASAFQLNEEDLANATTLLNTTNSARGILQQLEYPETIIEQIACDGQYISIQPLGENSFGVYIEKHHASFSLAALVKAAEPILVISAEQVMICAQTYKQQIKTSYKFDMQKSYNKTISGLREMVELQKNTGTSPSDSDISQLKSLLAQLEHHTAHQEAKPAVRGGYNPRLTAAAHTTQEGTELAAKLQEMRNKM